MHFYKRLSGYQKALELWNSFPRPKEFCEVDKVKLFAVLLQNTKCCYLRMIDTKIIYEKLDYISIFVKLWSTLWEAWPPFERPGFPVRDPASLFEAQPSCERLGLPVRGPASR